MRGGIWLAAGLFCLLAACGYVGPVLPPSPLLPQAVTDLTAVERGNQIEIRFSAPARTTDSLPIAEFSSVELGIGVARIPFDFDRWAAAAQRYEIPPPPPADPDNPVPAPLTKSIPVSDWIGKRVAIAVRTAVRKNDHFSAWSNREVIQVVAPLVPPVINTESTAKGVRLSWNSAGPGVEYRVYRKIASDAAPVLLGKSKTTEYLDTSSQYGTPYEYTVIAYKGSAESLASEPAKITTRDEFPPSVPAGVTALAGPTTIEVSWQRSPEPDLKGYFVYRSVDSGAFEKTGALVSVPAYSDHDVQHGHSYRYAISAVDQHNNESDRSAPVQASY